MKPKLLIFLTFLFSGVQGFAGLNFDTKPQPDSVAALQLKPKRNFIWVNVGQLSQKEIQLSYEKQLNTGIAIEATLGYKYPKQQNQEYHVSMGNFSLAHYYDYIARIPYATGFLGQLAIKTSFPGLPGAYLSGSYFYRYWYFNDEELLVDNMNRESNENFHSKMSLRMQVHGFRFLSGYPVTIFRMPGEKALKLDFYGGLSFRSKVVRTDHETYRNTLVSNGPPGTGNREPFTKEEFSWIISPQLGCKLGFNF